MNENQLKEANLRNLTELWKLIGFSTKKINGIAIASSRDWPHRIWPEDFRNGKPETAEALVSYLNGMPQSGAQKVVIPVYHFAASHSHLSSELTRSGYEIRFAQTAMVLSLKETLSPSKTKTSLCVQKVEKKKDVATWAEIASRSFGYPIPVNSIENIYKEKRVHMRIYLYDGVPAGTGMLWETEGIAGIHQLGVLPEYRRKGIAGLIARDLITLAKEQGNSHAVLQASDQGEKLYLQMGFVKQFNITNYGKSEAGQKNSS